MSIASASAQPSNPKAQSRRLRVLVLTSTFPRWAEDNEPRFVLDLCRRLALYADILVLAPHTAGAALDEQLEGVRVRRFRYFPTAWQGLAYEGGIMARLRRNPVRFLQLPFFLAALGWATRRAVRQWSPDVVHAHWIIPQGIVAAAAAHGVPIVCTSHGSDLHGLRGPFFKWLKTWALRRSSLITVVSDSMTTTARELAPRCPVQVIPMGTDVSDLFVPPPESAARDTHHVVFAGRLVQTKGLQFLLEAVAALRPTWPSLRLTIAGTGPRLEPLRRRTAELGLASCVSFLGAIRQAELPALLQRATVAAFPFEGPEGFGLVVVEAMGCGCPVVASDWPAVRQIVRHGVTGRLVQPRDASALAAAIGSVLADPEQSAKMALAAREDVRRRFDWTPVVERYREVIYKVASK